MSILELFVNAMINVFQKHWLQDATVLHKAGILKKNQSTNNVLVVLDRLFNLGEDASPHKRAADTIKGFTRLKALQARLRFQR
jgi:hypothetical protein